MMLHDDAPRKNADELLTPAYFGNKGGARTAFASRSGMTAFFLAIVSNNARRTPSGLLSGTTDTGSIFV
jgi:hypothetical protein